MLDPESNVQFGEGGAGTFSDGKLYSQIKDPRHLGRKVLTEFVKAGAPEEILTEAHPHIGTFRLVTMVESMRETIEGLGGEYRFKSRVADLLLDEVRRMRGVGLESGDEIASRSCRAGAGPQRPRYLPDAARPRRRYRGQAFSHRFSHRASAGLIDRARFGRSSIQELGAAEYKLVHHASNGRCGLQLLHVPRRHGGGGAPASRAAW